MAYSKLIQVGTAGSVTISEADGVASVKVSLAESAGGGDVAGFAKATLSAELDVSALQLVDAGLGVLESKYPTAAPLIATIKGIIDSEASKV